MSVTQPITQQIFSSSPYAIFVTNLKGDNVEVNPAASEITGYSRNELLTMNIQDFVLPASKEEGSRHFKEVTEKGKAYGEFPFKNKNGGLRWWSIAAQKAENKHILWFCYDITERVQTRKKLEFNEKKLTEQNDEYYSLIEEVKQTNEQLSLTIDHLDHEKVEKQLILNSISDMVMYHDLNMNIIWANQKAVLSSNHERDQIEGRPCYEHFGDQSDKICEDCPVKKTLETGKPAQLRKKRKDGRTWNIRAFPVFDKENNVKGVVETMTDVTRSLVYLDKIRQSEITLRKYIENSPIEIFIADSTSRYTDVNPAACQITGYSREELLQMTLYDLYEEQEVNLIKAREDEFRRKGKIALEVPFLKKDGEKRYWWISAATLESGQMIGFVTDITQNKHNEERLKQNETWLKLALKTASMGYWRIDIRKEEMFWSDSHSELLGTEVDNHPGSLAEVISRHIHPDDREEVSRIITTAFQQGESFTMAFRIVTSSQQIRWLQSTGKLICDNTGKPEYLFGISQDITESKKTEAQLKNKIQELEKFNKIMIGRENKMVILKDEINRLLTQLGLPPKYKTPDSDNLPSN